MEKFRQHLKIELPKRIRKSSRYSLRAFSIRLGNIYTILSAILACKRKTTENTVLRLCSSLNLTPEEYYVFFAHDKRNKAVLILGKIKILK